MEELEAIDHDRSSSVPVTCKVVVVYFPIGHYYDFLRQPHAAATGQSMIV
jgi:hypothetical protein